MDQIRKLPDSELSVMQALWRCEGAALRREIAEKLDPDHPLAETTLLTLLTRLAEKGFIRIEKESRSSRYMPLVAEADYLAEQSGRFIKKLCRGNLAVFANALCDSGLSAEEIEELRELLKEGRL